MNAPQAAARPTTAANAAVPPGWYVPPQVLLRMRERSAAIARAEVRRALRRWGMRELIADTSLVACELVTNAVAHVQAHRGRSGDRRLGFTVRRVAHGVVRGVVVEVHDPGAPAPLPEPRAQGAHDDLAETGRGLLIVDALTGGAWGVTARPAAPGKLVWALLASSQP